MLAGDIPPPGPEELRLRPLDVSALIDVVRDRPLLSGPSIDTNSVAMIDHSSVATLSLQIAGGRPTENKLRTC
jgi:predicted dienelactone hydrolase